MHYIHFHYYYFKDIAYIFHHDGMMAYTKKKKRTANTKITIKKWLNWCLPNILSRVKNPQFMCIKVSIRMVRSCRLFIDVSTCTQAQIHITSSLHHLFCFLGCQVFRKGFYMTHMHNSCIN